MAICKYNITYKIFEGKKTINAKCNAIVVDYPLMQFIYLFIPIISAKFFGNFVVE